MHVECSACHARYVISDEKIPIQGARVRCRKCQAVFNVERPGTTAPPAPAELPLIPPTPQAASPPPPPVSAESSLFGSPAAPLAPEPSPFGGPPTPPPPAPAEPSPFGPQLSQSRFDSSPFETAAAAPTPPAPSRFDSSPFESAPPSLAQQQAVAEPKAVEPPAPPAAAPAPMPAPVEPQAAPPPTPSQSPTLFSASAGLPAGLSEADRLKHERARRLARVLASDIAIYNKEKRERGVQEGNLVAVLGYEIKKSWEVYKERVTPELANSTPYFRDALNDMLAEGKKVF